MRRIKDPLFEIEENQETAPVMNLDGVPTVSPDASVDQVVEAFLASRIPNRKTARGYRRHILHALGTMGVDRLADLSEADLSRANLRGANLRGAYLSGANLRGAGKIAAIAVFSGLYRYQCWAVITDAGVPWVRMGCLFKPLTDWDSEGGIRTSNPGEFPDDGSEKCEQRVRAFEFTRDAAERMAAKWATENPAQAQA